MTSTPVSREATRMTVPPAQRRPVVDLTQLGSRLGMVLAGLGLLAIGIGWNGAASNDLIVEQLPYVLSGGLLGLALVVLGAAFTVVQNAREDSARLALRFEQLAEAIAAGGTGGSGAPRDVSGLVAAGTASFHAPSCRLVDGREPTAYLTPVEAVARGLKACRVCAPAGSSDEPTVTVS